ncbi:MAG: 6,7-dimethyl-8-ribityllumazine synthase [Bacteroidaceae bacterium]|nr:6,7-dimethyl-8-ribityllumazine synthase [Bacteroidaceae bacterium]
MATALHNLSDYDSERMPSAEGMRFGIVTSEWNSEITGALTEGARETLLKNGARTEDIQLMTVPGSFELVYGAASMVETGRFDAVIAIGCVIRGDTPHFDYICQGTTQGLAELNCKARIPVIYGLLTCNDMEQAEMRAGGMLGNKGDECAVTAIKMVDFTRRLNGA